MLVVEDEPEFLRRFAQAVAQDPALRLLQAVATGGEALAVLERERPDVMLVDLGLPDMSGLAVMHDAVKRYPEIDILVVTMFGDDHHVLRSIEMGATGYLLKDAALERIGSAIRELHAGGSPISPSIARRVLNRFRGGGAAPSAPAPPPEDGGDALSERETQILRLIAKGLSFKEAGAALGISPHTVAVHLKRIYRKLAVHSRGEAVYEARLLGLL
nr:response regulator transcription factor [Xylophilus sp.]